MADRNQKNNAQQEVSEETRFKYIGFEIYPGKTKEFWKSEEEKKKYLDEVRQKGSQSTLLERDHSLVKMKVFSSVDRLILTITSILMVVSLFLPWFSVKGIGSLFFFSVGSIPAGGALFGIFVIFMILTVLSSAGAGVISLLSLYKKQTDIDSYLINLKKKLKLNYFPLVLWVILILISIIGMPTHSASSPLGGSFNVIDLFTVSSLGMWLSLPSLIINCVKISDL
jgi:hypothetical protein